MSTKLVQVCDSVCILYKFILKGFTFSFCFWPVCFEQDLEAALSKKENCIAELDNNLQEQKQVNIQLLNEIKFLNERLNSEARRIKSLERDGDRLRSGMAILEAKVSILM